MTKTKKILLTTGIFFFGAMLIGISKEFDNGFSWFRIALGFGSAYVTLRIWQPWTKKE